MTVKEVENVRLLVHVRLSHRSLAILCAESWMRQPYRGEGDKDDRLA
jgi:hypothetical protein